MKKYTGKCGKVELRNEDKSLIGEKKKDFQTEHETK